MNQYKYNNNRSKNKVKLQSAMGLFDSIKNQAIKIKLQGEIVLLDREIVQRKNIFGIELYDLLYIVFEKAKTSGTTSTNNVVGNLLKSSTSFISIIETTIKEQYYDVCTNDITTYKKDIEYKELQIIHSESARERAKPAITNSEIASKASKRLQDTATETKLQLDISLLHRSIRQKKEQFGNDIYDILHTTLQSNNLLPTITPAATTAATSATSTQPKQSQSQQQQPSKVSKLFGITAAKSVVSKNLSKLNTNDTKQNENDIKNCIIQTIHDIDTILQQKTSKQKDIDQLV